MRTTKARLTSACALSACVACSGEPGQGEPNGTPFNNSMSQQGTIVWNGGAEGTSSDGLVVQGFAGYDVAFGSSDAPEVLRFRFAAMVEGEHDLGGTDGALFFKTNYYSTQEGGWARVTLVDAGEQRIEGQFASRTCFKDTPDMNCFDQKDGHFTVFNNTGEALRPLNAIEVANNYPRLDALSQTRAEWTTPQGAADGRSQRGARFEAGRYVINFSRPSWNSGATFTLSLTDLGVGVHDFDDRTKLNYSTGGTYAQVSDIDGGGGSVEIVGNDGQFIWGTMDAKVCFSRTPRFNCIEFNAVRFSAAIEP